MSEALPTEGARLSFSKVIHIDRPAVPALVSGVYNGRTCACNKEARELVFKLEAWSCLLVIFVIGPLFRCND
jgi:hypothetical protein